MGKGKEKKGKNNNQSTIAVLREALLKRLNEEIKNVKYTPDEKKAYFKWLDNLFDQINWNGFKPWEKTGFFRRWFAAISDEYMKALIKYESLLRQYQLRQHGSKKQIIGIWTQNMEKEFLYSNEEAKKISDLASLVLGLPVNDRIEDALKSGEPIIFHPAKVFTIEETTTELFNLNQYKRCYSLHQYASLRFLRINIQHSTEIILREVENIIEQEKQKYYTYFPERKPLVRKETKKGIHDVKDSTYRFEEWERYLKVYMRHQQGITFNELTSQFHYHEKKDPDTTLSQVKRDNKKAKTLSENAVADNFPGIYQ